MNVVTLEVASEAEVRARMEAALAGRAQGQFITFPSYDLLWQVLSPRRWAMLQAMAGQGPLSIREVARRVGRDIKGVHGDMQALLKAGIVDRTAAGKVEFPYDAIHVDFTVKAA